MQRLFQRLGILNTQLFNDLLGAPTFTRVSLPIFPQNQNKMSFYRESLISTVWYGTNKWVWSSIREERKKINL